jgi:hypothetical protein
MIVGSAARANGPTISRKASGVVVAIHRIIVFLSPPAHNLRGKYISLSGCKGYVLLNNAKTLLIHAKGVHSARAGRPAAANCRLTGRGRHVGSTGKTYVIDEIIDADAVSR